MGKKYEPLKYMGGHPNLSGSTTKKHFLFVCVPYLIVRTIKCIFQSVQWCSMDNDENQNTVFRYTAGLMTKVPSDIADLMIKVPSDTAGLMIKDPSDTAGLMI